MKDEITYETKPLKRQRLGDSLSENMGLIIILLAIIILIALLMYSNGNQTAVLVLAEVLTMVEI